MRGYKNIAISGGIGTGKTTLATNLEKYLGWQHLNTGEYIRDWYKKHNVDLNQTDQVPEEIDRGIDRDFQDKMQNDEHIIFESRLAGYLAKDLPDVLKVLCTADYEVASSRAAQRDHTSSEIAKVKNKARDEGLSKKFERLYNITNYLDPKYFDLVVDTTHLTPEEVLQTVLDKLNS